MCTKIRFIKNDVGLLYCISDADLDMQHNVFFSEKRAVLQNTV